MNSRKMTSVALAAAAAMAFSMAAVTNASAADAKVHCEGVNSCKGKGFLEMTQAQCDAAKAKAK